MNRSAFPLNSVCITLVMIAAQKKLGRISDGINRTVFPRKSICISLMRLIALPAENRDCFVPPNPAYWCRRERGRERERGGEREREREGVMLADFNHNIIINSAWCGPQATVVGTYGRLNIYTSDSRIHSTSQAGMGWPINYFRMTRACGIII